MIAIASILKGRWRQQWGIKTYLLSWAVVLLFAVAMFLPDPTDNAIFQAVFAVILLSVVIDLLLRWWKKN